MWRGVKRSVDCFTALVHIVFLTSGPWGQDLPFCPLFCSPVSPSPFNLLLFTRSLSAHRALKKTFHKCRKGNVNIEPVLCRNGCCDAQRSHCWPCRGLSAAFFAFAGSEPLYHCYLFKLTGLKGRL